jgi:predicted dehydrogenase
MNWGIIGLGHMAKNFANSIQELADNNLLGVSSNSLFKLIKFSYRYKINYKYLFNRYQKILECPDIDSIYIGTLNNSHFDLIIKCIDAKKNILCEKPFVLNFNQANIVKEKLKNSNIFFLESIGYRSHPQTKEIIRLIKENYIGDIVKVKSTFGFNSGSPKKKGRLLNKELGGGSIFDLGCYPISMSNLIANVNNEKEIAPTISEIKGKMHETGVDLNGRAKLFYSNGIESNIEVSITEDLENNTIIYGTDGFIKITNPWLQNKESVIEIHKNNGIKKLNTHNDFSLFAHQIELFNNSVRKKNLGDNYPAMSIDNSVNCIKTMMEWKKSIF